MSFIYHRNSRIPLQLLYDSRSMWLKEWLGLRYLNPTIAYFTPAEHWLLLLYLCSTLAPPTVPLQSAGSSYCTPADCGSSYCAPAEHWLLLLYPCRALAPPTVPLQTVAPPTVPLQSTGSSYCTAADCGSSYCTPADCGSSYPGVPEELGEHHQVGGVQGDAHVGCGDGEHSHAAAHPVLEELTPLMALGR